MIVAVSAGSADGEADVTLGVEGAMKTKCECGQEFEAPAGAASAKCPRCGRAVKVEQAADWLAGVDLDGLSLEKAEGPEKAQEPAAQAPTGPRPGTEPAAGPAQKPRAGEGAGPVRPSAGQGALRIGARSAAPSEPVVLGPPPSNLLALGGLLKDNPKGAIPHLREGIASRSFVVQLGATFLGLALVAAVVRTWSVAPRDFAVGAAAKRWMTLLIEMAASGVLFSLIAVLLKREAKPLGMCEALALVRGGALLILTGASVVLGLLILLAAPPEAAPAARAAQAAPAARAPRAVQGAPPARPRPSAGPAAPAQGARPQPPARGPQAGPAAKAPQDRPAPRSRQAQPQGAVLPLLLRAREWFWAVYFVPVVVAQMFFVMNLLKLGCWPTVIGNIVATYAAYAMAERVTGAF